MSVRLLRINLTDKSSEIEVVDKSIQEKFIGGKGLGAYLLYRDLKGNESPLEESIPLMFLTGPLTGSGFPTSGRMVVVSKSPLTGTFVDSHAGGYFGNEMKKAGYDGIIITGKAEEPVYLWIKDDKVVVEDATSVSGKTVSETVRILREETERNARIACIGPAGENLSLISSIMIDMDSDKGRSGIAGRSGLGATMGSKNIKAIAVKGSVKLNNKDDILRQKSIKQAMALLKDNKGLEIRKKYGSANLIGPMNELGFLPTNNFKNGFIDNGQGLYCEAMNEHKSRNVTCHSCPIDCGQVIKTKENEEVKIEYESVALLGSNNGLKDILDVADANRLCNELGLDSMSAGVVTGFAMECMEKGLIVDGPEFGNAEKQKSFLENLACRRGTAGLFTDGVKKASEKLGDGSEKYAIHVKGLEMAGYEPRTSWGMALAYATADRGACHQRCWTVNSERAGALDMFTFDDKVEYVIDVQDERASAFSMLVCDFLPFERKDILDCWKSVTGITMSEDQYLEAGERIWNLVKLFNLREGFSRKDDTLPDRMFEEPLKLPGNVYDVGEILIPKKSFDEAIDKYYELRGWDCSGNPRKEKLERLGLTEVIQKIE